MINAITASSATMVKMAQVHFSQMSTCSPCFAQMLDYIIDIINFNLQCPLFAKYSGDDILLQYDEQYSVQQERKRKSTLNLKLKMKLNEFT